jgi:hypothetical protein
MLLSIVLFRSDKLVLSSNLSRSFRLVLLNSVARSDLLLLSFTMTCSSGSGSLRYLDLLCAHDAIVSNRLTWASDTV